MRIAITGANGHIGCNLARHLRGEGHELRLLVHQRQDAVEALGAELIRHGRRRSHRRPDLD
jgi:nucleoside-diphosphate-sugar epimerase